MPQINAGDFRKGVKIILDGEPYDMLECNFVKPGKGQALYKTRLRNLLKGTILDRTYKSGDSLEAADIRKSDGQYLYRDPSGYVFMDNETFEQYTLPTAACEDQVRFLLENSLGAWWAARHAGSPLLKEWEYLRFRDDGTPAAGTFPGWLR